MDFIAGVTEFVHGVGESDIENGTEDIKNGTEVELDTEDTILLLLENCVEDGKIISLPVPTICWRI